MGSHNYTHDVTAAAAAAAATKTVATVDVAAKKTSVATAISATTAASKTTTLHHLAASPTTSPCPKNSAWSAWRTGSTGECSAWTRGRESSAPPSPGRSTCCLAAPPSTGWTTGGRAGGTSSTRWRESARAGCRRGESSSTWKGRRGRRRGSLTRRRKRSSRTEWCKIQHVFSSLGSQALTIPFLHFPSGLPKSSRPGRDQWRNVHLRDWTERALQGLQDEGLQGGAGGAGRGRRWRGIQRLIIDIVGGLSVYFRFCWCPVLTARGEYLYTVDFKI